MKNLIFSSILAASLVTLTGCYGNGASDANLKTTKAKCGTGKCGDSKKETKKCAAGMKCGAGKCGGGK